MSLWFWMDVTSSPNSFRVPEVSFSSIAINLRSVLLPEPLPPAIPTRSLAATEKDTLSTA